MQRALRCPACGRLVDRLVDGLCEECYRKEHPLVDVKSASIEVEVCRVCGSMRFKRDKWVSSRDELGLELKRGIHRVLRVQGYVQNIDVKISNDLSLAVFRVTGRASRDISRDYMEEYVLRISPKKTICETCMGHISKKKQALIQIRAHGRKIGEAELRKIVKELEESISEISAKYPRAIPVEVEQKPEGLDVYFSDYPAARKVAEALSRRMPLDVLETGKLIGVDKSGREKFKMTIRLALPGFMPGDVIRLNQQLYYVLSMTRQHVELLDLQSYNTIRLRLTRETSSKIALIASESELGEGLVLSRSGNFIQVLNLASYQTFEAYFDSQSALDMFTESERVKILFHDEKTYLIPSLRTLQEEAR